MVVSSAYGAMVRAIYLAVFLCFRRVWLECLPAASNSRCLSANVRRVKWRFPTGNLMPTWSLRFNNDLDKLAVVNPQSRAIRANESCIDSWGSQPELETERTRGNNVRVGPGTHLYNHAVSFEADRLRRHPRKQPDRASSPANRPNYEPNNSGLLPA